MQNPLPFYPEYNSYSNGDAFPPNAPDTSIESHDVFGSIINPNQMPIITPPTTSNMMGSKKRKATIDTDASFSPASIYSDNSNYSDTSYPTFSRRSTDFGQGSSSSGRRGTMTTITSNFTTSAEEGSSDDNDDEGEENDLARKREKHTQVEAQRRALEKAHFKELSMLITNRSDSKTTKLHHLDLLKIAADQISEMNNRHKHDPLRPSNLTDNELNFLTIEASNSFLFVTSIEQPFQIIYCTDSINRILNLTPEQWRGQSFLSFVHREDSIRVQSQLMSLNQHVNIKVHMECRLKQGQNNNNMYSSVIIDGITKMIDHSLKPVQGNNPGFLAFVGICHLPLITKYSETNMCLYKNPNILTLRCRCSPHDWKIFLVDRSVSNLPSVSYDSFRQKSILEFISPNEQAYVHQILLRSTTASTNETITCHFIHPNLHDLLPMSLEIKSFFNPIIHRADFIELTFKSLNNSMNTKLENSILDFFNETKEIDDLLAPESLLPNQQQVDNPTTQNEPFYYPNNWPITKDELF